MTFRTGCNRKYTPQLQLNLNSLHFAWHNLNLSPVLTLIATINTKKRILEIHPRSKENGRLVYWGKLVCGGAGGWAQGIASYTFLELFKS